MKRLPRLVIIGAALSLLAACSGGGGSSGGSTPVQGGTATFAEPPGAQPNWIFPFLDQAHNSGYATGDMQQLMYRTLYWFGDAKGDTGANPVKSVGELPKYSNNNSTVVVNIKPYKWSNGESVDADDVMFWMNMEFAEKANFALYAPGQFPDNVTSVTKTGPQQVTFQLTGSYSPNWFTGVELAQVTPMPQAWDKTSDSAAAGSGGCTKDRANCAAVYQYLYNKSKAQPTYATDPLWQVVDGPWHLKSYNADGNITYDPNPKYSGPDKPHLNEYKMLPFTSRAAEYNVLRGGSTVSVGYTDASNLPQKPADAALPPRNPLAPRYNIVPAYAWGWASAILNYDNPQVGPVFKQLYARQALQQALDQQTAIKVALRGYGVQTNGPVPTQPDNKYVAPAEKGNGLYPFNVNQARQRMTTHGWAEQNGVLVCAKPGTAPDQCGPGVGAGAKAEFNLIYTSGNAAYQQTIQQWKTDAAKAGITLNIKPEEFNQLQSDISSCKGSGPACDWQMAYFGYNSYLDVPTGDQILLPGAPTNVGNYNDPKMNQLVENTLHSGTPQAFADYTNYAAEQLPGQINFPIKDYMEVVATNLKGVYFNPVSTARSPEEWYFTK